MVENLESKAVVLYREFEIDQKIKDSFGRAFSYQLTLDGELKCPLENEEAFTKRRLLVYADAIKRGEAIVLNKLEDGEFKQEIFAGRGFKQYTLHPDKVTWQIIPSSADVFANADFFKAIRDLNIETRGEGDIFTDQYLVHTMLQEGLKEQNIITQNFLQAYSLVKGVTADNILLNYFKGPTYPQSWKTDDVTVELEEPKKYFDEILRTYRIATGHANNIPGNKVAKQSDIEAMFAQHFIVSKHSVLNHIEKAIFYAKNLKKIASLFTPKRFNEKNREITIDERQNYENSLAIELLAGSTLFTRMDGISYPETLAERIFAVNRLLHKATDNLSQKEANYQIALIIYKALENQKPLLVNEFKKKGIDPEMGIEYIQALLRRVLTNMPCDISPDTTLEKLSSKQAGELRRNFLLSEIVIAENNEQPKKSKKWQGTTEDFIKRIFTSGVFPSFIYDDNEFTPQERQNLIRELFRSSLLKESGNAKKLVRTLLRRVGIKYEFLKDAFADVQTGKISESLYSDSQKELLSLLVREISLGNNLLQKGLEDYIYEEGLPAFLKKNDLYYSSQINIEKKINFLKTNNIKRQGESYNIWKENLYTWMAGLVLSMQEGYDPQKSEELILNFSKIWIAKPILLSVPFQEDLWQKNMDRIDSKINKLAMECIPFRKELYRVESNLRRFKENINTYSLNQQQKIIDYQQKHRMLSKKLEIRDNNTNRLIYQLFTSIVSHPNYVPTVTAMIETIKQQFRASAFPQEKNKEV